MQSQGNLMKLPCRTFLHLAAGAAGLLALSRVAWPQTYPSRPITMIVPFPADGPLDTIARIMAEGMRGWLGQPIIIENVSGAGGTLGVASRARQVMATRSAPASWEPTLSTGPSTRSNTTY